MAQSFNSYTFTATTVSPGFDDDQVASIANWARLQSDSCYLVEETTNTRHLHGVFRVTQKSTNQVTRKFKTLYSTLDLPWVEHVSVKVKKTTELVGWFHYLRKSQGNRKPLVLTGWSATWITEQCAANVKKIPKKLLLKGDYQVNSKTGTAIVIEYGSVHNLPLCDKFSFADVLTAMAADKYTFDTVRIKWLFCQVMARCGHPRFMKLMVLGELQFIDD